jgi:predicted RNA-binding protein with PUA-like domain
MKYWLMKSEPDVFGIADLCRAPQQRSSWDGVRNYQVRNMMRDDMRVGDLAFFYHSSCAEPGIYGVMRIVKEGHADTTAFDAQHDHFDPKSDPTNPTWYQVDVEFVAQYARPVTLELLRANSDQLSELLILRRGNRLSVTPITPQQWKTIESIAHRISSQNA